MNQKMRELKFRAWECKKKKMIENPSLVYDGEYYIEYEGELLRINSGGSNPYRFELMQYTGLKDKNGKEIYEGDILIADNGPVAGKQTGFIWGQVKFGEWSCPCEDYYCSEHGYGFYLEGKHGYYRLDGTIDRYPIENTLNDYHHLGVVGNIYENPELLEKKD